MNQVLWNASRPKITSAGTSTRAGSSFAVRTAMEAISSGCRGCRGEGRLPGVAAVAEVAAAEDAAAEAA